MFDNKQFLPSWLYEGLRWVVSIVLPATATLIAGLNDAWGWALPIDAILTTFSAVETFLGAVFLGAKVASDHDSTR
jgi:hypothetical protein